MKKINYSDIKYEVVKSAEAVKKLVDYPFDDIFRENEFDSLEQIKSVMDDQCEFLLFSLKETPCALVLVDVEDDINKEIILIEVSDKKDLRRLGIGRYIINVLGNEIYPNSILTGYSVPEASTFWTKVAKDYDKITYELIQEGYDTEEEEYNYDELMKFTL